MTVKEVKRALVGRRIVAADARATFETDSDNGSGRWMHHWVLTLDDGRRVFFVVEEHPAGADYGVDIDIGIANNGVGT